MTVLTWLLHAFFSSRKIAKSFQLSHKISQNRPPSPAHYGFPVPAFILKAPNPSQSLCPGPTFFQGFTYNFWAKLTSKACGQHQLPTVGATALDQSRTRHCRKPETNPSPNKDVRNMRRCHFNTLNFSFLSLFFFLTLQRLIQTPKGHCRSQTYIRRSK